MSLHGQDSVSAQTSAKLSTQAAWVGSGTTFFGRYVDPTSSSTAALNYDINRSNTEFAAMINAGIFYIAIVTTPTASRISSNNYSYGVADAKIACAAVDKVLSQSPYPQLPSSGFVRIYLDDEPEVPVTINYWNGWASTVFNYVSTAYPGRIPYYPACYTNPNQRAVNCTTFRSASYPPNDIWSYQPEYCAGCRFSSTPAWGPYRCASPNGYTSLWQLAIDNVCSGSSCRGSGWPNIDVDAGYSTATTYPYMLSI